MRQDLRLTFKKAIKSAHKHIHITMYALTDPLILKWLRHQNVETTLYFDPSAGHIDSSPHFQATALKAKGLMHKKILIIDDALVFLGSANMTTSSLLLHDNLTIGFHSPPLAQFLQGNTPSPFFFQVGQNLAEIHLLPDKEGKALTRLIHELDSAKKSISLSMFTLTHPLLIQSLISAKNRGVNVTLCIDFYAARGASKKALSLLSQENIPILLSRGQQLLHHKWALIDNQTFILGSTNWTKAAFTKNQDCLLFLKELSSSQIAYLKKLWKITTVESTCKS